MRVAFYAPLKAPDHPVLPTLPETEYFKGVLLEMMPGR